jgi:hypothetical protein
VSLAYGPTTVPTASPLAYDELGKPIVWWDCGLPIGTLPSRQPRIIVELFTPDGFSVSALFPSTRARVLVDDPGREIVIEYVAALEGQHGPILTAWLIAERRSDGLIACELILANGNVPWRGCIRFLRIGVRVVTAGWASTPISMDMAPAGDWYWGIRTALSCRFVCYEPSIAGRIQAAHDLHFRAGLTIPSPVPCLGAGRHSLPRLLNHRQDPLGGAPILGPFVYDSVVQNGFDSGGKGIECIGGWEGSEAAALSYAADVPRIMARHGVALVDPASGEPYWPERWQAHFEYHLQDDRYVVDSWNWASVQGTIVGEFGWVRGGQPRELNPGPCLARPLVLAYQPHNAEHLARVSSRALPAWQLCRSWAARWLMRMNACDVMTSWDLHGSATKFSLASRLAWARAHPARGGEYLREQAWPGDAVAAALSITASGNERDRYLAWREAFLEYLCLICMRNGFARDGQGPQSDNGVPWLHGLPRGYGAAAVFQLAFWVNAVYDLWVNGPPPVAVDITQRDWMLTRGEEEIRFLMPLLQGSPREYVGVSHNHIIEEPLSIGSLTTSYSSHYQHDHHALALAYKAIGSRRWKTAMWGLGTPYASAIAQLTAWEASPGPWTALAISVGGAT